jgi:hypothetical protein
MISDTLLDTYGESIDAEELYRVMKIALRCECCSRLWLFYDDFNQGTPYLKEQCSSGYIENDLVLQNGRTKKCLCGYKIPLYEKSNPFIRRVISDVDYDKFSGIVMIDKLRGQLEMILNCPNCMRMWFYKKSNHNELFLHEGLVIESGISG